MKSLFDHLLNTLKLDEIAGAFTICDFGKNWNFSDVVLKQIADKDKNDEV